MFYYFEKQDGRLLASSELDNVSFDKEVLVIDSHVIYDYEVQLLNNKIVPTLKAAYQKIDEMHAHFVKRLTGDSTVEEMLSWAIKYIAANNYINGQYSNHELNMLALECGAAIINDGIIIIGDDAHNKIKELALLIIRKSISHQMIIGKSSNLRNETKWILSQTSPEFLMDKLNELGVMASAERMALEQLIAQLEGNTS
jgi:hypothetical protein